MSYLHGHGTRETEQSQPMRTDQVENSAGGWVWEISKWDRLKRFLVLGSEGGTYYARERELTASNISCLRECIAEDGERVLACLSEVSMTGAAPSNDPALYALAACISLGDKQTRRGAAQMLPAIARIGTHLYHFIAYAESMRGWGRTMRWAVSNWYESHAVERLAYDVVKYRQRDGWSHRDALRLSHPKAMGSELDAIYDWVTHRGASNEAYAKHPNDMIEGYELAQISQSPLETARLVREYGLPREALKTEHLQSPEVWHAMLELGMPMTAMVRNLGNMTRIGALDSTEHAARVLMKLSDTREISKSRIHPMTLLVALKTYAQGHGMRGKHTWVPKPAIIDCLDESFYLAFGNVEPSGKRTLLALDVSSSMMHGSVCGSPLTPAEAAAAMLLVTAHAEPTFECMAFTSTPSVLPISKRQRLDDVLRMTTNLGFGSTDCALPFMVSRPDGDGPEAFALYTDNETWAGRIHPAQALRVYREKSGLQARSVVVGLTATKFSIADPQDPGMLDVVGFDLAAPALISSFLGGRI